MLPLIGRQAEWRTLLDAWRTAAGGDPCCVAVVGEAGIGKSRLVEELTGAVSRQGYAAAVAHCYAAEGMAEGMAAYSPVIEWLQNHALAPRFREAAPPVLAEASRLLPELLRLLLRLLKRRRCLPASSRVWMLRGGLNLSVGQRYLAIFLT